MREEIEGKVRQALAEHEHGGPGVDLASALTEMVVGVIEGAGEWEYRARLASCGFVSDGWVSAEAARAGLLRALDEQAFFEPDESLVVERARQRVWLPVEEVPA